MRARASARARRAVALVCALVAIAVAPCARAAETPHVPTAFHYGAHVPATLLAHFDRVVVEPDAVGAPPVGARAQPFAYVSVGEVDEARGWRKDVPPSLVLGTNPAWKSVVVDTRSAAWRAFLLDRVIEPLYARGYRGVFLDTLDSYERVARGAEERAAHARGIAAIVTSIRARHPDVRVLMNRGFDVLPLLASPPDGLVVESLFRTADAGGTTYRAVDPEETKELLARLAAARARAPSMPVTVIDYVPRSDRALRRATALRIWQAGFDPYVTVPSLDEVGLGRAEIVPRRVLVVHHPSGPMTSEDAVVVVAPILEWLGYAVDYADVEGGLPEDGVDDRYAGVVALLGAPVTRPEAWRAWVLRRLRAGTRIAFLEGLGVAGDGGFLARLGLAPAETAARRPLRVAASSREIGFEAPPRPTARDLPPARVAGGSARSLLRIADADGDEWDGVVLAPWGGAVFAPYLLDEGLEEHRRWIVDPFAFLREALALPPIPAPDVTTESGRRILTFHVDGDGFASRAERPDTPFTGEVILREILERHPVPQTVSIIEGEVAADGLYPKDSPQLEAIARAIFALPWVRAASHTYSHPFDWAAAEAHRAGEGPVMLAIPGYTFDRDRDLRGSIRYIESRLLPPGHRVSVLLWSGDCSPSAESVAFVDALGVANVNGGGATRTRDVPSLTAGSALGIPYGDSFQVFAPVQNENVYTNDWHGPFYAYDRVIETFELNDRPRRLSPVSVYYHFYSAAKTASLAALERVYAWALAQETTRLYIDEYAAKVRAFERATLARRIDDGAWELGGMGELRTVRIDGGAWWPDLARSSGVAGVRDTPQGRYVTIAREADAVIVPTTRAPSAPRLAQANARVVRWAPRAGGAVDVRLAGHEPIDVTIAGARACSIRTNARVERAEARGDSGVRLQLPEEDTGDARLECR